MREVGEVRVVGEVGEVREVGEVGEVNGVYSRLVELPQDQLLQCWQEHSTHGQPPRTSTGGARQ